MILRPAPDTSNAPRERCIDLAKGDKAETMRSDTKDDGANTGAGSRGGPGSRPYTRVIQIEMVRGQLIEVEITCSEPTPATRKAVEDFFDWLYAEAQKQRESSNGRG